MIQIEMISIFFWTRCRAILGFEVAYWLKFSCQNIEIFITYALPVYLKVGLSAVREASGHANDRFQ